MSTIQSLIIGVFLISALVIFLVRVFALKVEQRTRFEAGIPATATVVEVNAADAAAGSQPVHAALRFWVEPPAGTPFKTRAPWLIASDHLSLVRVGQVFPVRIDTVKQRIVFPNVFWATYDWKREQEIEKLVDDTQPI